MAAKKKSAVKKKATGKKKGAAKKKRVTRKPAASATAADVKKLDSGWRSFIRKAVGGGEQLTLEWHDPVGAPSTRTTINAAVAKKARKAARKSPASRAVAKKKPAKKKSAKK